MNSYPSLPTDSSAPQSGVSRNNQGPEMIGPTNIPNTPTHGIIGPIPPPPVPQHQGKVIEYLDSFQGSVVEEEITGELFEETELFEYMDFEEIQEVNMENLKR
mmetsp:Transcript_9132/g.8557  ORF Transcript_9132/g.8557 Transcript_9132/m.8557 type:complete len:103 (-) Transcript_9132:331-639(-)